MRKLFVILFLFFGTQTYSQTIDGITTGEATFCNPDASGMVCCTGNIGQIIGWNISSNFGSTWMTIPNNQNCITYFNLSNSTCYRATTTIGYSTITCITILNTIPPEITENGDTLTSSEAVSYQWFLNEDTLYNDTNRVLIISQPGIYHVETIDSNGCISASSNAIMDVEEINSNIQTSYFPNPSDGNFKVQLSLNSNLKYKIQILNVFGEILREEEISGTSTFQKQFDLSSELNGVYFLSVENANRIKNVHRIILNK